MRCACGLLLGLLLAQVAGTAQSRVERIELCELLRHPEEYNGKEVTVRATHSYMFEVSTLYCLDCQEIGKVWLDFSTDMDEESERALRTAPDEGIINLTVTGTFLAGGAHGHLGLRYGFVAKRVRNIAVLSKGLKSLDKVKAIEAESACGGRHPK